MSISSIVGSRRQLVKTLAAAAAIVVLAWPQAGMARHERGPFAAFSGDWRGGGHIVSQDGRAEPISCRARYDISEGGASLSQSLVCASDSYRLDIRTTAVADGESVRGNWQETTRGISGNISGQIANGAFQGTVDGPGFNFPISLRANGRTQTVQITPHAGGIDRVEVSMRRAG